MTTQILEILTLGVIAGAIPGPILTAVFTEILNSGLKKGTKIILRALVAESTFALIAILTIFAFNIPKIYFHILSIIGAVFLTWIATEIWNIKKIGDKKGEIFPFSKIFILTILNGAFWIFWLTVYIPKAFALSEKITGGQFIFLIVFELGWLLMTSLLALIFSKFRPLLLKKNIISSVFKFFAILLIFFALKSVYTSINFLIN